VGDLLIICTYAPMSEEEARRWKPRLVLLDARNAVKEIRQL
jgi:aspartate 1-decarboxylase